MSLDATNHTMKRVQCFAELTVLLLILLNLRGL